MAGPASPPSVGYGDWSTSALAGLFAGQGITAVDYLRFLAWATLGNVLGGVFLVALVKYGHVKQG